MLTDSKVSKLVLCVGDGGTSLVTLLSMILVRRISTPKIYSVSFFFSFPSSSNDYRIGRVMIIVEDFIEFTLATLYVWLWLGWFHAFHIFATTENKDPWEEEEAEKKISVRSRTILYILFDGMRWANNQIKSNKEMWKSVMAIAIDSNYVRCCSFQYVHLSYFVSAKISTWMLYVLFLPHVQQKAKYTTK